MTKNRITAGIVCAASLMLVSAQKPELRFITQVDLPNLGLKIKVMPTAKESPIPPPTTYTYSIREPGKDEYKVEMYSPVELWLKEQHAGRWVDEFGNILTLATVKYPLPEGFQRRHVTREEFQKKIAEVSEKGIEWNMESLAEWMASFTGATSAKPEIIGKPPFTFQQLFRMHLSGSPSKLIAYVFQLNRNAAGQSRASQNWYVAIFQVEKTIPAETALKAIDQMFFQTLTSSRATAPREVAPSASFQSRGGTTGAKKPVRSPEFETSRKQVVDSIKNMSGWWFVETDNFIILSNLKSRFRALVNDLQNNIELLRDAYEQFMPARKEMTAVSVIRVFQTPEEYESYVGPAMAWTAGVWVPSKKELVVRPVEEGGSREQKAHVMKVTYHEAFHQYMFYAMDQIDASPWFNEGHACFFEVAVINEWKLDVSENEQLAEIIDKRVKDGNLSIKTILAMDLPQFYAGSQETRQVNYALAWGLVYYLRKWAPLDKANPAYAGILEKYSDALWSTKNAEKATEQAFEGIDLKKFQADWEKFWTTRSMRSSAKHNKVFKDFNPRGK